MPGIEKKPHSEILAEDYCRRLSEGESLADFQSDGKIVAGGFLSSQPLILHDGPRQKTIACFFHVPKADGSIRHFDIAFMKFTREKNAAPWIVEKLFDLRDIKDERIRDEIDKNLTLLGKKVPKKFYKSVSSNSDDTLANFEKRFSLLANSPSVDFTKLNEDSLTGIFSLISRISSGENIVLEKRLYHSLIKGRGSTNSIQNYERQLDEFQALIKSATTTETEMQEFLSNKIWFFGLNYFQGVQHSKPKFSSSLGSQYDFLLEGFNQVYDIVELKGPNEPLFDVDTSSPRSGAFDDRIDFRFSPKFGRALHQVINYMDEFENSFEHIKQGQPSIKDLIYPKGMIVISKRDLFPENGKNSDKFLRLINRQFANIDILTYDDLADRGRIIINFLKSCNE